MKNIYIAFSLVCSIAAAETKFSGTFEGQLSGPTFFDSVSGSFEVIFDESRVENISGFQFFFLPVEEFEMTPSEIDIRSYDPSNVTAIIRYLNGSFYGIIVDSGPIYSADGFSGAGAGYSGISVVYRNLNIDRIDISTESGIGVSRDEDPIGSLTVQQTSEAPTSYKIVPIDSFSNLHFSKTSSTVNSMRNPEDYMIEESWFSETQITIDPLEGEISASGGGLNVFPAPSNEASVEISFSLAEPLDLTTYDELVLSFSEGLDSQPVTEIELQSDDGVAIIRDITDLGSDLKNNLRVALYEFTISQSGKRILPRSITGITLSLDHTFTSNDDFFSLDFIALRCIKERTEQQINISTDGSVAYLTTTGIVDNESVYSFDTTEDLQEWIPESSQWQEGLGKVVSEQRTIPSHSKKKFYRLLHFPKVPETSNDH